MAKDAADNSTQNLFTAETIENIVDALNIKLAVLKRRQNTEKNEQIKKIIGEEILFTIKSINQVQGL